MIMARPINIVDADRCATFVYPNQVEPDGEPLRYIQMLEGDSEEPKNCNTTTMTPQPLRTGTGLSLTWEKWPEDPLPLASPSPHTTEHELYYRDYNYNAPNTYGTCSESESMLKRRKK